VPITNTPRLIRIYASNGTRLRDRSLASITTLAEQGRIAVSRNRRGTITCAQFISEPGGINKIRATAHMGQAYSFPQSLPSGHKTWKHRSLLQSQEIETIFGEPVEDQKVLDLYLRSIFRRVALDCIADPKPAPTPTPANVFNIADYANRRKRTVGAGVSRPIEFDSERRRAA
jgi:hypothetical protein